MSGDESFQCPACFVSLARPHDQHVAEVECPSCGYVWSLQGDLQQTVEHTPMAKRRSVRPGR